MKRKIYNDILKWKNESNGSTALLIEGARRVGKSYIVEEFAKENYKSYILIDFSKAPEEVKSLFDNYLDNLNYLFTYLSQYYGVKLYERETLFIFDEIQLYPKARQAIKHLVADGRYDYIETGSLISIKKNVKDILIPSEEYKIQVYPMDYEEFLWATNGNPGIYKKILESKMSLGDSTNRTLMKEFRIYMAVVGLFGIQIACQMTFVALGNAKASVIVAVTRKFILLIPLIYIMPALLVDKTMAVYLAEPVADLFAITFTVLLFRKQFKKALEHMN